MCSKLQSTWIWFGLKTYYKWLLGVSFGVKEESLTIIWNFGHHYVMVEESHKILVVKLSFNIKIFFHNKRGKRDGLKWSC